MRLTVTVPVIWATSAFRRLTHRSFSAWFEAYLDGQWYSFDARNNVPRIGRVLMARGRDAADVALTTTFEKNELTSFKVWTDEVR
jgi:transglutaminase-like putative cysteine protease